METTGSTPESNEIRGLLHNLEARISRIEARLNLSPLLEAETAEEQVESPVGGAEPGEGLEFRIGQNWFARVGIVALAVGIAFLLTLPYTDLPPAVPSLFGFLLVGGLVVLSHVSRQSFSLISRYLLGGGLLLLFFATLRLYFFSEHPAVSDKTLLVVFLLFVVALNFAVSIRRRSVYLTGMSLAMGYATALVGGSPAFVFLAITILAFLVTYFKLHYHWYGLLIVGIVLGYLTHLIWAINNPFLGNELQLVASPQYNLSFILLYAVILASGEFFRAKDAAEDIRVLTSTTVNGLGSYGLFLLLTVTSFKEGFALYHLLASFVFLVMAVGFWIREKSKYATFVYAMIGYTALSVAIVDQFGIPDNFIWLSWQTVLVVSTAIWFRSRFIVVANFIIYLIVFIAYLIFAGKVGVVSLSFGVIALLSARILNWQRDRLELKTEMMRNAYLACAFFIFPYALYHAVPGGYVSLSWVGVALFYYITSLVLRNRKYRWMALLTLLITVAYVFVSDIVKLEPGLRVVSFLVLGVVLLAVSILYSRSKMKGAETKAGEAKK
jgi:hypothetical protein